MTTTAAEHVFVGIPGTTLDSASAALLEKYQPGGVILFKRNIEEVEQLAELVAAIRRLVPNAVMSVDAEGGKVDRLRELVGPAPAAALLARQPPSLSLQAGLWIAQALRLFDLDVTFAPVVDLNRGETDNALDGRYLGATPGDVTPRARAFLRGLHSGGAGGCLKHFPGLGGAQEDTHFRVSCVYLPSVVLQADLDPFQALVRLSGAVMAGHAIYPAYDAEKRPATLSPHVLGGLLRGRLAFNGLCFSDDLEMKALDEWGDLAERCGALLRGGLRRAAPLPHAGGPAGRRGAAGEPAARRAPDRGAPPPGDLPPAPAHAALGARLHQPDAGREPGGAAGEHQTGPGADPGERGRCGRELTTDGSKERRGGPMWPPASEGDSFARLGPWRGEGRPHRAAPTACR